MNEEQTNNSTLPESKSEEAVRLDKLASLQHAGIDPYPSASHRTHTIAGVIASFNELESSGESVTIAGRIRTLRRHGGSTFALFEDGSESIQLYFKKDEVGDEAYELLKTGIDAADFIQATGTLFHTHKGEQSILVKDYTLLTKTLLPLPEKWHGLSDTEVRYRQRYLDLLANKEVQQLFKTRAAIITRIRAFLDARNFLEVETPVLQPLYGGALARPFVTYHNALDANLYLRIAPELYLKRLIVGGYERVYEIGKCFRNEGIDKEHNPEFTMLEFYQAYADYNDLMDLTEEMFRDVVQHITGGLTIEYEGSTINFEPKFERISFRDLLIRDADFDMEQYETIDALVAEVSRRGVEVDPAWGRGKILDETYKALVRPQLVGPLFLTDHPLELSPLAKKKADNPEYVERFQLILKGREVVNAFSELNDPIDQQERFEEQERLHLAGDDEALRIDEDYITALKHGMPPTAGWGMGIDRLTSILSGSHNLKEVILFPTLKPKGNFQITKDNDQINSNSEISKAEEDLSREVFSRDTAVELMHAHVQNENLRKHMYAAEAVMRSLARKFGGHEDAWGIAGLLHDMDWEETESNPEEHSIKAKAYLEEAGVDDDIVTAIHVHNHMHGIEPVTPLEKALYVSEELTGLITACALVRPDKKLEGVKVSSILKKLKVPSFAAGVDRSVISRCDDLLGMSLEELATLELEAMQGIADKLGL